ncbi:hypothetical protein H6G72_05265 [Planktothricoides sp. FACHB-1370]|uniref:Uncharacterized protein n=1 Tax=Planktothricoides raciborskii FACHB-1370 TaxID=2949576 RepID=A0ABR8EC15_9CYAN|nr:hypothetical protein [Planktothricoides raciborskii FACHB-1370]
MNSDISFVRANALVAPTTFVRANGHSPLPLFTFHFPPPTPCTDGSPTPFLSPTPCTDGGPTP